MNDAIVKISNLSKAYRIGLRDQQHDTLGAAFAAWIRTPLKNFKRLKDLADINSLDNDPDIFWALRNINFEVKKGEVLGIIGKNGAGKSTLLKILSRITEPTSGRVEIFGRVASLLEVGTGFNPELTGRENVYLNGTILGMNRKEIDRKFAEIVEFSGVEKFIDTPVKRYSSGMKVRLAFAVAAHLDPEILIIDEVLAVGDAEFQRKCLGKMQDISGDGKTILFVSHDLVAVQKLCSKLISLRNGKVSYEGDVAEGVKNYLNFDTNGSNEQDLSNVKRKGFGKVKFKTISFVKKSDNQFNMREKIVISLKIESDEDVSNSIIYIAVKCVNNVEIFYATNNGVAGLGYLKKGLNEIIATIDPNFFMPGDYSLRLTINQGGTVSDWIDNVSSFVINPFHDDKSIIPDFNVGYIHYPIEWIRND
jgi:lipopolysaccharide transport system ATP-binding protein